MRRLELKGRKFGMLTVIELNGSYIRRLKAGAKTRNLPFEVSKEYLWELFISQNRKCKMTGLELTFANSVYFTRKNKCDPQTASLDRIDSKKGYIIGNLQWIHKTVKMIKMDLDNQEFINLCKLIAEKS